ncbi:MAG TPA: M4 family metallopeptidase [Steroidobacteraceae bacterium]|nr:M4 family metallopeptidase [Steroidobacteraceae bacterium]
MKRLFFAPLVLCLAWATVPALAAPPDAAGFRALSAQQAASFRVPADVTLVAQGIAGRERLRFERYQQKFGEAEVLGGQLTIYRAASGEAVAVIGNHFPAINALNTARLNAGQAQAIAARQLGGEGEWKSRLMIDASKGRYFFEVENRRSDSRWFYWVDAETGDIVNAYDGLTHGSGTGVQGDTKDLAGLTRDNGGHYQLISSDGRQTTYDAGNRNRLPGSVATDGDDTWDTAGRTSPGQAALVDAQFYAKVTDDYLNTHGFNWLSHYPQGMVSSAHLQRNYNNAYWNGTQMAYGDGDGVNFVEFSGDLDVVGHELAHGVTEATSNLIYQNESGALNEAFSDIMGTAIEFYNNTGNWTIGEDVGIDTGSYANGIRNMANPGEDGDPSHYADRYTGTGDNGGVHINSGIANHWFYLLVSGGQNANPARASGTNVQGIGLAAAEDVAFLGFTALPANASFCAARASTVAVAGNTVAGNKSANVADAWDEVGVTEASCGGNQQVGGSDTELTITNVASKKLRGGKFQITWTTDVPSDSVVIFTLYGSYTNSSLVTSHKMQFNGSIGASYGYSVSSTSADGQTSMVGPFTHQN